MGSETQWDRAFERECLWLYDANLFLFRKTGGIWTGLLVLQPGVVKTVPRIRNERSKSASIGATRVQSWTYK